jgi:hypothetical protein
MTTHSHLVSNVRMSVAVPPGLQYVHTKHRYNFTLAFLEHHSIIFFIMVVQYTCTVLLRKLC